MTNEANDNLFPCPCCGSKVLTEIDAYEVCDVCDWEDDPVQRKDGDFEGGANELSLNQAQKAWCEKQ